MPANPVVIAVSPDNRYFAWSPYDTDDIPSMGPMEDEDKWKVYFDYRAQAHGKGSWDLLPAGIVLGSSSWYTDLGTALTFTGTGVTEQSIAYAFVTGQKIPGVSVIRHEANDTPGGNVHVRRAKIITGMFYSWLPPKNPEEHYSILCDFAARRNGNGARDWLDKGDHISSVAVTATNVTHSVTSKTLDDTATISQFVAGTAGNTAEVKIKATMTSGQIKVVRFKFNIGYK